MPFRAPAPRGSRRRTPAGAAYVVRIVLRPVVEVLGQPVGRADDRKLVGLAEHVVLGVKGARPGSSCARDAAGWRPAIRPARSAPTRVRRRTGPARTGAPRLGQHDERAESRIRRAVHRVVGRVAGPALAVPRDADTRRIPRTSLGIGRAAVVEDAPVRRPADGPVLVSAEPARVALRSTLRQVAGIGVGPDVEPVPDSVEPSARASRNRASCCPARMVTAPAGSRTSCSAQPLISLQTSSSDGCAGCCTTSSGCGPDPEGPLPADRARAPSGRCARRSPDRRGPRPVDPPPSTSTGSTAPSSRSCRPSRRSWPRAAGTPPSARPPASDRRARGCRDARTTRSPARSSPRPPSTSTSRARRSPCASAGRC